MTSRSAQEQIYHDLHDDYHHGVLTRQEYEEAFTNLNAQQNARTLRGAHIGAWALIGIAALLLLGLASAIVVFVPWLLASVRGGILAAAILVGLIAVARLRSWRRRIGLAVALITALGLALIYVMQAH